MRLSRSPTPSPRKSPSRSSGRPTAPAAMTSTPIASATAKIPAPNTAQPRYSGEQVLLFSLDSNLRLGSVKDAQGRNLEFFQARERKERSQSYGAYVAVVLKEPTQAGRNEVLEFQYGGKHVVRKVGDGNYFCQSFGWYPSPFANEPGVDQFAFRSDFDLTFRNP